VQPPNAEVAARYAGLILEHRGATLEDVYEARILVEAPAVGLLARTRTEADLEALRSALEDHGHSTGDRLDDLRTHNRFHALLVQRTGNQTLRVLLGMLEHIVVLADWTRVQSDPGSEELSRASRKGLHAHHRVVELVEAGDDVAAERLWRRHLTEAKEYLLRGDVRTVLDLLG
jgi:DNA-binding FadR family transcriptional regulator